MMQHLARRAAGEALSVRKRLCALEARERLREAGRSPQLPLEFTSQYGECCWLWELFGGKLDGFFIEVGAFDGHRYSVSYPFEAVGWTGLLVEPIPDRYEKARVRRPNSRVVHGALGGPGSAGTATFTVVEGQDEGMLSYLTPTPANTRDVQAMRAATRCVSVPLTTMNDVLAAHDRPIDFAVIDVEGAEVELLKGFDLKKHRPRVLMVEEGLPSPSSPVSEYLAQFPYTPVAYPWINRVYVHRDEPELIHRGYQIPVW
jgi:FkbM family methyltransferase